MTTTLIVLAHPDRRSFNGAWAQASIDACAALGHTVLWSDLSASRFDAVESACHYGGTPEAAFDPLKAQQEAAHTDRIPADVAAEIDKIRAADRIIFHFPLWWFAPPAVLKGWFDRVLLHGALHSVDARFDQGLCRGKSALFCVTTGSQATESAHNGKEGDARMLLWPAAYTLRYLGFDVLEPRLAHGVHGYHSGAAQRALQERLRAVLAGQHDLLAEFDSLPGLAFNTDDDFDASGTLRPDRPSHSPFIRHAP